jgi:tetratricopeptide (TPR) repeat protein
MKIQFTTILSLIFLSILVWSCSPQKAERREIAQLEAEVEMAEANAPDGQKVIGDSLLKPLMEAYAIYVQKYPEEDEMTPIYLYRMGSLYYRMGNWKEAVKHFEYVLEGFEDSEAYPEAMILAATLHEERLNNKARAEVLYKSYLEKFPDGAGRAKASFFFKSPEEKMQARIGDLQNKIREDEKTKGLNRKLAHMLVRQYAKYVEKYPNSEFAPMYCFEGGKLASNLGETADAIELWLNIYDQYHDFHLYPETILLLAVEYENKMPIFLQQFKRQKDFKKHFQTRFTGKDWTEVDWLAEAEKLYKEFLVKYPKHELTTHAAASLKYLGKDPNEVVQEFKVNLDSLRRVNSKEMQ